MTRARLGFVVAVAFTYATSGWARVVAEHLRSEGWLAVSVAVAFIAVGAFVGERLATGRHGAAPVSPGVLIAAAAGAALLFTRWELPEERFHLALYPLLGYLAWLAVGERKGRSVIAIVLILAVGLGDEAVQGLHPERRFDWMDVLANGVGGAIVPLLTLGGRAAWSAPALLILTTALFAPLQRAIGVQVAPPAPPDPFDPAWIVPTHAPTESAPATPQTPDPEAPYSGFDILLVTIDALRADHVPPYGRAPVPTPHLDSLAAQSVAVRTMWSPSTWTSPAMLSIFTALHPAVQGVDSRGLEAAPGPVYPLETLAAAGWRTWGFVGDDTENYRHLGLPARQGELADALAGTDPVFAWTHLRDVHAPYDATPERLAELGLDVALPEAPILDRARSHYLVERASYPGRHDWLEPAIAALYAAEVADADAALGAALDVLAASGRADRTIVVLTADHGEELLENDGIGHASTTLDSVPRPELVQVPLLIRFPDGRGAGERRDGDLRHEDLLPSLLPLLGVQHAPLSLDPPLHGQDRSMLLLGDPGAPELPLWFVGSPCGWQCPVERRHERAAAVIEDGEWSWCRYSVNETQWNQGCPGRLGQYLFGAANLAQQLKTPSRATTPEPRPRPGAAPPPPRSPTSEAPPPE